MRYYDTPWHQSARTVAYIRMIRGNKELDKNKIIPKGYLLRTTPAYNASRVGYDIHCQLVREGNQFHHVDYLLRIELLFEHSDPADSYPSDELKTKILLVTG